MGRRLGQQSEFTEAALRSIAKLPGVTAVGMGYRVPMAGGSWQRGLSVRVAGKLVGAEAGVEEHRISHGYFKALGTPMVQGREFTSADDVSHDLVAVVSRTCARLLFGTENAVGRVIHVVREQADLSDVPEPLATELKSSVVGEVPRRIVGVVDDIRTSAIGGQFAPVMYTEYRQQDRGFWYGTLYPMFIVRAPADAPVPVDRVIAILREMPAGADVVQASNMREVIERSIGTPGGLALLSFAGVLFMVIAGLLVGLGVYTLLSDALNRRQAEWGVRIALGASPRTVLFALVREVLPVLATGLALGTAATVASTVLMRSYVMKEINAETLLLALLVICSAICAAAVGPLRRALTLDPVRLLRTT
jgi:hypothetical protein